MLPSKVVAKRGLPFYKSPLYRTIFTFLNSRIINIQFQLVTLCLESYLIQLITIYRRQAQFLRRIQVIAFALPQVSIVIVLVRKLQTTTLYVYIITIAPNLRPSRNFSKSLINSLSSLYILKSTLRSLDSSYFTIVIFIRLLVIPILSLIVSLSLQASFTYFYSTLYIS